MIIEPLALSDKCALSLTCKNLQRLLPNVLRRLYLPSERNERLKLLFRMFNSFPGKYLCEGCAEYHTHAHAKTSSPSAKDLELFPGKRVSYLKLPEAMAAYRADSLNRPRSLNSLSVPIKGTWWHASAEFQVDRRDHTLLVRVTHELPVVPSVLQQPFIDPVATCSHFNAQRLVHEAYNALAASPRPWDSLPEDMWEGQFWRCGW